MPITDEDASRPSTPVSKPAAAKADSAPGAPTRGTQKTRGGPASRGGRYYQRGGKSSTQATQDGAEDPAPSGEGDAPKRKCESSRRVVAKCLSFTSLFRDNSQSTVANVVAVEVAAIAVVVAAVVVDVPSIGTARRANCTIPLSFPLMGRDLTL